MKLELGLTLILSNLLRPCPPTDAIIQKLSDYGYNVNVDPQTLFRAFQMHFRPANYHGNIDPETAAIVYALCDKYRGKT